ncbi:hypothetical protein J7T55_015505 [Diaporthe amygdali]|uniref:uncharacterized protein n=1 Tax=Phomopsis amygdali TaxID=1214568 RepID=UPI0022FEEF68|nr:uncharacterized protein J7T55_015505 [Diaporthe amygdali]KAJ0120772.1 hypothetical protein J7T55_015505 [Diaporthe amygdali]
MDTTAVIKLSCQAAESVLRFRAVGFTRRPTIDLQSFRAAITSQIEKVAKDHRHRFEVPLTEVANYAGIGASRAAQQWNDISHEENHVAAEWFRNCVCNLVSGVVSDIGQMAFEDQGMNACMYLEPDDYDPFDVPSYATAAIIGSVSSSPSTDEDNYYGFEPPQAHENSHQSPANSTRFKENCTDDLLPLRHEIEKGFASVERMAASQTDTSARAEFIQNTKSLRSICEPVYSGSSQQKVLKRPAKRARLGSSPLKPLPLSAGLVAPASHDVPRAQQKFCWTEEEVKILLAEKNAGRKWQGIEKLLPRHTLNSCQRKWQILKSKDASLQAPVDDVNGGEKDQSDHCQTVDQLKVGDREGTSEAIPVQEDEDKPTSVPTKESNQCQAESADLRDNDKPHHIEAAFSSDVMEDAGGVSAEDSTTKNKKENNLPE